MKPLNSKEREKKIWQFIFIVTTLCFVPICLVFFSYYKTPIALTQGEIEKLVNYSSFEHTQKTLLKEISTMNEDLAKLATNPGDASVLDAKIGKSITSLTSADSGKLIKEISKGYAEYLTSVKKANEMTVQIRKINDDLQSAKADAQKYRDEATINSNRAAMPQ